MRKQTQREYALKLYGRAMHLAENASKADASGSDATILMKQSIKTMDKAKSIFKSLPSSKTNVHNIAKGKAMAAAQEQTKHPSRALGPPPITKWVIAQREH
jgi:hypothetical protein